MNIEVLGFGIAKDIFEGKTTFVSVGEIVTVKALRQELENKYPKLKELASYMVAVNDEYAEDELLIKTTDEVAVIPPVSGG